MNKASTIRPSRFDQTRHMHRRPVTVGSILSMLKRQWKLLVATALLFAAIGLGASFLIQPVYDASAIIRIIPVGGSPLDFDKDNPSPIDQAAVSAELATIQSRDVAERVVRQLGLQRDPEFLDADELSKSSRGNDVASVKSDKVALATASVQNALHVDQQDKGYIVTIGVRSHDPAKASRIANAWADAYMETTASTLMDTAGAQAKSSQQRLSELGHEVEAADARLATYRAKTGLSPSGTAGTVTDQQVAPLSVELATAESQAAASRAALAAAEQQVQSGGFDAVSAVLSSTVIAELRKQRSEAEKQRADLDARYGSRFPAVVQIQKQIDALDQQIRQEAQRIVSGLRSDASAAEARAGSLRARLGALRGEINQSTQTAVVADSLQRQAEAKRSAYNRLAETAQQYSQARQSSQPQARLVERAEPPKRPVKPNRRAMLAGGLVFGCAVGFLLIVIREASRTTVRGPDDLEALNVRYLGSVQHLKRRQLRNRSKRLAPSDFLIASPMSAYAEALRTVRSALQSSEGVDYQAVSVSSTFPGEGKTTTALSLARVMAMSGERVILIDCDLRRAGIANATGADVQVGTVEVLSGDSPVGAAIIPDVVKNLDLLPVIKPMFSPIDLFSGNALTQLIDSLRGNYDRIIIDTPPLLGIADARTISSIVDGVLLIVKWDWTPVSAIDAALAGIEDKKAHIIGGVLTMVDPKSEAAGAAYYSKLYSKYYV